MKKELNRVFYTSLLTSIILVVIGILLLFFPNGTIKIVSYILGAIMGITGIMGLIKFFLYTDENKYNRYGLAYGIVLLVVACLFFFKTDSIAKIMPFALGIYMIISSAIKVEYTLKLKKDKNDNWKVTLVMAIVSILFGLVLIFNPLKSALYMTQVIGIVLIFYAILDMIDSYIIKCNLKEVKELLEEPIVIEVVKESVEVPEKKVKKASKKTTSTTKKSTSKKENLDEKKEPKKSTKTTAKTTTKKSSTDLAEDKKTSAKKTTKKTTKKPTE